MWLQYLVVNKCMFLYFVYNHGGISFCKDAQTSKATLFHSQKSNPYVGYRLSIPNFKSKPLFMCNKLILKMKLFSALQICNIKRIKSCFENEALGLLWQSHNRLITAFLNSHFTLPLLLNWGATVICYFTKQCQNGIYCLTFVIKWTEFEIWDFGPDLAILNSSN